MLLLQTPGSFLVVIFQGLLYHESVSTWLSFLFTGLQQLVLLILCIIYDRVFEKLFRKKQPEHSVQADEKTPLKDAGS
jgi:hypothetical protein